MLQSPETVRQQVEIPYKVIDRIAKQVISGKINPDQLISDADFLLQKAGEEGRKKVQPFLHEAVRRSSKGVIQVALIDRLTSLYRQDLQKHDQGDAIRRYIRLGEDLEITGKPEGQQFLEALREKYDEKPFAEGDYVWKAREGDFPVKVTGSLGRDKDGREYVAVEGSSTGVPRDELSPIEQSQVEAGVTSNPDQLVSIWQDPSKTPVEHIKTHEYGRNMGEKIMGDNFVGFVLPSNEDENTVCEDRAGFVELADGTKIFLGADGVGGSFMGGLAAEEVIAVAVKVLKDSGSELLNQAFDNPQGYVDALGSYMMEFQQYILEHYGQNIQNDPKRNQFEKEAFGEKAKLGSQTTFFMVAISPAGSVRYLSVGDGILEKIDRHGEVEDFLSTEKVDSPDGRFSTVGGFTGEYRTGTIDLTEGDTLLFGTDGMKHNLERLQLAFSSRRFWRMANVPQVIDDLTVFAYRQELSSSVTEGNSSSSPERQKLEITTLETLKELARRKGIDPDTPEGLTALRSLLEQFRPKQDK